MSDGVYLKVHYVVLGQSEKLGYFMVHYVVLGQSETLVYFQN